MVHRNGLYARKRVRKKENNGGNSDGDPPLPIPNREVKPVSADGTAIPSGRVGSRQPSETFRRNSGGLFFMPIDYQRFVHKDVVPIFANLSISPLLHNFCHIKGIKQLEI